MPTTESPAPPASPSAVVGDVPCLRCGYNLRSLLASAACPECGTPVAHTLHNSLRFGDPKWLKALHNGAGWIYAATVAGTLCILFLFFYLDCTFFLLANDELENACLAAIGLVALVTLACWVIGVTRLARAQPGEREPAAHRQTRILLQDSPALVVLIMGMSTVWLSFLSGGFDVDLVVLSVLLALWIGPLVLAARLRDLFTRVPAPALAAWTRWVMRLGWCGLVVVGLWLGSPLIGSALLTAIGSVVGDSFFTRYTVLVVLMAAAAAAPPLSAIGVCLLALALRRHLRSALAGAPSATAPGGQARTAADPPARPRRLARWWLPVAVAAAMVALNLWPFERWEYEFKIFDRGDLVLAVARGWPLAYHTDPPRFLSGGAWVAFAVIVNLIGAAVLVALAAGLARDRADRTRREAGEAVSYEL